MGGIILLIYNTEHKSQYKSFLETFSNLKHRGTSYSDYCIYSNAQLDNKANSVLSKSEILNYKPFTFIHGYHRQAINDQGLDAVQPFQDPISHKISKFSELRHRPIRNLMCNGEIYNYTQLLKSEDFTDKDLQSQSDVEIIMPLYIKYGIKKTLDLLNVDFSFVLTENIQTYDLSKVNAFVVRDILGTKRMYMIKSENNSFFMFVSELKAVPKTILNNNEMYISEIPPGHYWSFKNFVVNGKSEFTKYFDWNEYIIKKDNLYKYYKTDPQSLTDLYGILKSEITNSILIRYKMSNLPVGILLSGGINSCIILTILVSTLYNSGHDFEKNPIYAFSIGDIDSDDITAAQQCVFYLEKTFNIDIHFHIVNVKNDELIIQSTNQTVFIIESYDTNTIKTATVFNIIFKYIKEQTPVKVLLSGDGLNEISKETITNSVDFENSLKKHLLRCDKLSAFYGLEIRYPFLDKHIISLFLNMHPELKSAQTYELNKPKINKFIIRKTFNNEIPNDILWKEPITPIESVSYINETIKNYCDKKYSDLYFHNYINNNIYKINNKEDLHYRLLFNSTFPKMNF